MILRFLASASGLWTIILSLFLVAVGYCLRVAHEELRNNDAERRQVDELARRPRLSVIHGERNHPGDAA